MKPTFRPEFETIRNTRKYRLADTWDRMRLGSQQQRIITAYIQRSEDNKSASIAFTFKTSGDQPTFQDGQLALDRLIDLIQNKPTKYATRITSDTPLKKSDESLIRFALEKLKIEQNFPFRHWSNERFEYYYFFSSKKKFKVKKQEELATN